MANFKWQKLSPIAIVYFVVHFLVRFVKDGLINIAPAFAIFITQVENKLYWLSIGVTVITLIVSVYAVFYYLNFRFKINQHEVILRKGIFKKERVTLNFAKIQNVNLATPFYFSPFQLVNCQFDTAGSAQKEVSLPGIALDFANRMRDDIFDYSQSHSDDQTELVDSAIQEQSTGLSLSNFEVAKFGLMSGMAFIVLAVFAPFFEHITSFASTSMIEPLSRFIGQFLQNSQYTHIVAIVSVSIAAVMVFIVASVLGALVRFYNYELSADKDKIKRVSGLFERHQMSMNIAKIQSLEIKQNLVAKILKRFTIRCKQINNCHANGFKDANTLVVPVLTNEQVKTVTNLCWDKSLDLPSVTFTPIAINYFYKTFTLFWLLPCLLTGMIAHKAVMAGGWIPLVLILVVGCLLSFMRYKRYGFYFDGEQVFIRKGLFGVSYKVFKGFKIQQMTKTQTPLMRKRALSSLRFQLDSGLIDMPYLSDELATQTMDQLVYLAETSEKSWM
jgi:putative membrane protein